MLLIKNGNLYTMAKSSTTEGLCGDVLIDGGIIRAIGGQISAADADVIDAEGLTVVPGIIDAHVHIGSADYSNQSGLNEINEISSPVTPEYNQIYSTDVSCADFGCAVKNGITAVGITPGSSCVIGGLVFAAKTWGDSIFDMVIKNPVAMKVAMGGNPKSAFGARGRTPDTRMAIISLLREYLSEVQDYIRDTEDGRVCLQRKYTPEQLKAGVPVLKGELPLKIHSTRHDMVAVMEMLKKFNVKFTLDHAWGSEMYYDEIVQSGCGVIYGPIESYRGFGEGRSIDIANVAELSRRGVTVALVTDAPIVSITGIINTAGEAVRSGLDVTEALRMITLNAAELMGISDRVGSLEAGKDADIAIFKGVPAADLGARCVHTLIDGRIVWSEQNEG